MKINNISLSVFEVPSNTGQFDLVEENTKARRRWQRKPQGQITGHIHVLHVGTDEGIAGVCTVGDARYTTMRQQELEQLRILTLGHNPFDREYLNAKLHAATRGIFSKAGWFGAFDNCLWDIAGKVAGLPVTALLGKARTTCPVYANIGGNTQEAMVASAVAAVDAGFTALKDHFRGSADENIQWAGAVRDAVGTDIDLLHDAVLAGYDYGEALRVGRALQELAYGWLEEPLPDADQAGLQKLCAALDLPVLALETLMHDLTLSAQWLISGTTDLVRANARHGTTSVLKLAHLAELHGTKVELNGPGGLFGLVHAHLVCAIRNTSYYEYFPGGSRDEAGKHIGLLNPPLPQQGHITPPEAPGWGAIWDWDYFKKKRVAIL